jgi:hypothetical protein
MPASNSSGSTRKSLSNYLDVTWVGLPARIRIIRRSGWNLARFWKRPGGLV